MKEYDEHQFSNKKNTGKTISSVLYEYHFPYAEDHNQGLHVQNQTTLIAFFSDFHLFFISFPPCLTKICVRLEIWLLGIVNGLLIVSIKFRTCYKIDIKLYLYTDT